MMPIPLATAVVATSIWCTGRHRLALQTIENRVRLSERIGQFMK
jgi:hypothetical protein